MSNFAVVVMSKYVPVLSAKPVGRAGPVSLVVSETSPAVVTEPNVIVAGLDPTFGSDRLTVTFEPEATCALAACDEEVDPLGQAVRTTATATSPNE